MITLESLKSKKFEKFEKNEIVKYGSITGGIYFTRSSTKHGASYDRADTIGGPMTVTQQGDDSAARWKYERP